MDYECDFGYYRTEEGTCQKVDPEDTDKAVKGGLNEY